LAARHLCFGQTLIFINKSIDWHSNLKCQSNQGQQGSGVRYPIIPFNNKNRQKSYENKIILVEQHPLLQGLLFLFIDPALWQSARGWLWTTIHLLNREKLFFLAIIVLATFNSITY
jgi:hypothetical protein